MNTQVKEIKDICLEYTTDHNYENDEINNLRKRVDDLTKKLYYLRNEDEK